MTARSTQVVSNKRKTFGLRRSGIPSQFYWSWYGFGELYVPSFYFLSGSCFYYFSPVVDKLDMYIDQAILIKISIIRNYYVFNEISRTL